MGAVHAEPLIDASQIAANAAAIAAHAADGSIHFTVASIDHTAIANIGSNSHAAIDSHIGDTNIHFADAPTDANSYVRNNNAWVLETVQAFGEYRGTFDASGGVFPTTLNQGDWYNTTVAGTVDGQAFIVGDILVATVDSPSTTVFAGNWSIVPNISVTDHTLLTNIGVNTHAQLDTHLADVTVHFTEASIDHTNISNIGTNTHAVIDAHITTVNAHIADGSIHFTEGSIDHTAIGNIGTNSHAVIDAHIADGDIHLDETALDILYLRLDTANDPLTGELTVENVIPVTPQQRDLGDSVDRFNRVAGRLGIFVGESSNTGAVVAPQGAIRTFNGTLATGIMAGNQVRLSTGVTELQLQGGSYKAVATMGNVFSYSTGAARILNVGGGSLAFGSAFSYGAGDAVINVTGPGSFTCCYAYTGYGGTANNHTLLNSGIGSFLGGYSYGFAQVDVTSSGQGSFVQGFFSGTQVTGDTVFRATQAGAFAQGAIANNSTGLATLEATAAGAFAQGHIAGTGTIRSSGFGSFAQGRASAGGIIEATMPGSFAHGLAAPNDIRASGDGAFAIGDATAGDIIASGDNSCQFGPGTNALADTFQIGNGGIRFKGTTGAPSALQNGDVWVNAGYMYFRTNGVSVKMVACP